MHANIFLLKYIITFERYPNLQNQEEYFISAMTKLLLATRAKQSAARDI